MTDSMNNDTSYAYLKDDLLDRMARMNLELLSELWVTRDRLAQNTPCPLGISRAPQTRAAQRVSKKFGLNFSVRL